MHNKTILIIDDSESDQFITAHMLKKQYDGLTIESAYDGSEALEMIKNNRVNPDIILLDINMPGMDGFAFLDEYQALNHTSSIIIMLTSSDQSADVEKAKLYKCVKKYCVKPLNKDDVLDIL